MSTEIQEYIRYQVAQYLKGNITESQAFENIVSRLVSEGEVKV